MKVFTPEYEQFLNDNGIFLILSNHDYFLTDYINVTSDDFEDGYPYIAKKFIAGTLWELNTEAMPRDYNAPSQLMNRDDKLHPIELKNYLEMLINIAKKDGTKFAGSYSFIYNKLDKNEINQAIKIIEILNADERHYFVKYLYAQRESIDARSIRAAYEGAKLPRIYRDYL